MNKYYILGYEISNKDYLAEKVDLSDLEVYDLYTKGVSLKHKDFKIILKKSLLKGEFEMFGI